MLFLYSLVILLSSVSVCVLSVSAGPVLLDRSSPCQSQLKHLHARQQVTVQIPPDISGHWVSDSCEVRPGPEFLTRSYSFYPNHTFDALQFYYEDSRCRQPSYSLRVRGGFGPAQASWLVRGAAACEYRLTTVMLRCHGPASAELLQRRLDPACARQIRLRPGESFEMWAEPLDCTRGLDFTMQELRLIRVERRGRHGDAGGRVEEELFLGDVHTERAQRRLHQPSGYQTPLHSAKSDDRICQIVASADLHHPPVLPGQVERPVRLDGHWVSVRCEARPGVLFLTRRLAFHEHTHTWEGEYEHFSDPVCRHPTFSISASGRYTRGDPSDTVMGAVEFTFTVTHMTVTPMDAATTSLLSVFSGRVSVCGEGSWERGVPQDVTSTGGCVALGIRLPHTEYELFTIGQDSSGHTLLYNGQRPTNGSSPDRVERRPTSYQPPLIRCDPQHASREGDQHFRLSGASHTQIIVGFVVSVVLHVFMQLDF
ncbi:protein APCDD1-like [Siphateles boraxobius]|uniref:protein APCDD1-like n=1 Tax=Siphateles boraxobius TaxID=180520 RepID=UPI004062839B